MSSLKPIKVCDNEEDAVLVLCRAGCGSLTHFQDGYCTSCFAKALGWAGDANLIDIARLYLDWLSYMREAEKEKK